MFDILSSVCVLASTENTKTGPRAGSIGGVIGSNGIFSIQVQEGKFILNPLEVIFTRYGFEEKHRSERKFVLNIFPLQSAPIKNSDPNPKKYIDEFLESFSEMDFNDKHWRDLKEYIGMNQNTPVCTMIPVLGQPQNLLKCNLEEFSDWMNVTLQSSQMRNVLHTAVNARTKIEDVVDKSTIRYLRDVGSSKKSRVEAIRSMHKHGRESISTYISNFTKAYIIARKNDNNKTMKLLKRHMDKVGIDLGNAKSTEQFLETVFNKFFSKTFDLVTKEIKDRGTSTVVKYVEYIEECRRHIVSRAPGGGEELKVLSVGGNGPTS